jgi:hypothetical protein
MQGKSFWMGGRFFLQPLDVNGMRRLLLCDIDAAARSDGVAESDAPMPLSRSKPYLNNSASHNQLRLFEPETPQAHITGFRDEPVFYPGTSDIKSVSVTALLDVQVPGKYWLQLNLSGIQERAEAELSAGSAELTIPFPVDHLRELGSAGPFKIHSAQLTRQVPDGQIVAETRFDLETAIGISANRSLDSRAAANLINVSTQAYSLSSMGSTLYFTGQNAATLIRGIGAERDRLQVQIGIYSQGTDCRGGAFLARTDPSPVATVTSPPGTKTLVLNFTGKGASEPGPYLIEDMTVICGRDFIRLSEITVPASGEPPK